ncbi:DUF1801 domain-containing protein [Candidatus Poribacteria bacterium]|nr:DUF1801 domain-containing protein [Candidatus Poribacteria bacterium]MBT5534667.1 DUF1801 domain-containing protein [Candidatus Poribacteria bacterium]MBT5711364.1 DUF1801 domain-containing protein [Candidatus Poribacteria bacterium]MBT7805598.1 DUF1801 domain-containing protein [Candidatus Poribacteria bacterium]
MVTSAATTVEGYIQGLDADRAAAIEAVRGVILDNLPDGYVETMQYGMVAYVIPFERYPETYNKQPLSPTALASQKNYMSLYLHGVYADDDLENWFREAYAASGKKLNMGKSCVRFRKLADLPLDVVGEVVARVSVDRFIECYEASRRP